MIYNILATKISNDKITHLFMYIFLCISLSALRYNIERVSLSLSIYLYIYIYKFKCAYSQKNGISNQSLNPGQSHLHSTPC